MQRISIIQLFHDRYYKLGVKKHYMKEGRCAGKLCNKVSEELLKSMKEYLERLELDKCTKQVQHSASSRQNIAHSLQAVEQGGKGDISPDGLLGALGGFNGGK